MNSVDAVTYFMPPFEDNDQVKAAGGRWSQEKRAWFVPSGVDKKLFSKWIPRCAISDEDLTCLSSNKRKYEAEGVYCYKAGYCNEFWKKGYCSRINGGLFGGKKCDYKHERDPNFVERPKKQKSRLSEEDAFYECWGDQDGLLEAEGDEDDEISDKQVEAEFNQKAKAKGMTLDEYFDHLECGGNSGSDSEKSDESDGSNTEDEEDEDEGEEEEAEGDEENDEDEVNSGNFGDEVEGDESGGSDGDEEKEGA